jgi:hypothetical protein
MAQILFSYYEKFSFIQLAIAQPKPSPLQIGLILLSRDMKK